MYIKITETQQKNLVNLLSNADIKGADTLAMLELFKALQTPVNVVEVKKPKDKK